MSKTEFSYSGYSVYYTGTLWVAEPRGGDEEAFLHLSSKDRSIVLEAIDTLNQCTNELPAWLNDWNNGGSPYIDLDIVFKTTAALPVSLQPQAVAAPRYCPVTEESLEASSPTLHLRF